MYWSSLSASFCRNDIVFRRVLLNHGFGGTIIRELIWLHGILSSFQGDVSRRRKDSAFLRKHCSPFITAGLFVFENAFSTRIIRIIIRRNCLPFYFSRLIYGHVICPERSSFVDSPISSCARKQRCRKTGSGKCVLENGTRRIGGEKKCTLRELCNERKG